MLTAIKSSTNAKSVMLQLFDNKDLVKNRIRKFIKDNDDVEDIFQDVILKVHNALSLGKYQEEDKLMPWVMRIASNVSIDFIRRNKKFIDNICVEDCIFRTDCNIEENIINQQNKEYIFQCMNLLPLEQKEVVQLYYFEAYSFKEIAEMKNISINTALGRMRYAIKKLKKAMLPQLMAA